MRRHRLRTDIHQASWNYKHRDGFPLLIFVTALLMGYGTQSWLVGLVQYLALARLPHVFATCGLVLLIWGALWAVFGAALLAGFGIGTAIVGAFPGFALSWVPMRASEQYWRDLEKDGGPYSD